VRILGLLKLRHLRNTGNKVKGVVLATPEDRNELVRAVELGCSGVVMKHTASEIIVEIVRRVHAGKIADIMTIDKRDRQTFALSEREYQIMALAAHRYKNREIAGKLFISEQTVKNHLHHIYRKAGFTNRAELVIRAIDNGLRP
jgi:DNA-binding NarL/FixJ family response regulator